MPVLRTGLVPVAGYASKVRRTLFAQTKELVTNSKEWARAVAYGVAVLNVALYKLLVEELKLDKRDVIRVSIEYDLDYEKKAAVYKWDTLTIEVYKKQPQESYLDVVERFKSVAEQISIARYTAVKVGETLGGDEVYSIRLGDREVGVALVFPVDESTIILKRAVLTEPSPAAIGRMRIELAGSSVEQKLVEIIASSGQSSIPLQPEQAARIIETIKSSLVA